MTTAPSNPDPVELAELYVAGAVSEQEREHFEGRLKAGDEAYVAEYRRLEPVAAALLDAAEPVAPNSSVRESLRKRLTVKAASPAFSSVDAAEPDPISEDRDRMVIVRRDEMDWRESGVPGVQVRNLFVDQQTKRLTVLIRMEPGARYPDHEHPDAEECMVLDGDLHIAGTVLRKFDYLRTPGGGEHGEPWTENGCLLLVTSPLAA